MSPRRHYLAGRTLPTQPQDLLERDCLNYRSVDTQALYRWEFERDGERFNVAVAWRVSTKDNDLLLQAALDGFGFGFAFLQHRLVQPHLAAGRLVGVLDDWIPRSSLYLYYYNPSGLPRKLRVFIDFLR